uniref:HEAT repeat-containing protein 1 n=1 Tax=Denticeps clupeoides TaxID=299321 RepID=A0AAY4AU52_9TELE
MTSLAHQLKRLALPQNDPSLLSRREVTSLLFDPKEAASMDRGTFYALGCTGLDELLGIEPAFAEFQDTLFNSGSVGLERSIQTKKVNKKLNKDIGLFLTRLSPYFLLKPALKCAEWLIHRFHIHLYNQDCLVACALPYHETKVFVRVIQLLKIEDPTDRWNWLHGLQFTFLGTLLTHCYKDLGFMDFICSLVTQSVKVHASSLRVIISFYASTIVSALDAVDKITDSIIAKILPHVHLGLKSSLLDYKAASYMIVCQLAVKVVMEPHLVNTLAALVSRCLCKTPELSTEGLGCLIVLLQNQKEGSVGRKVYGHLCEVSNLVSTLHDIAAAHDVSALLRYFLPHLVRSTVTQTGQLTLLGLSLLALNHQFLFRLLLEEYLSYAHQLSSDKIPALNQHVQPVVQLFESKYPATLDTVLDSYVSSLSSEKDRSLFHQFISLSMSRGKYEILAHSETSLMLSLKHPLATVRSMALQHLQEILKEGTALDEAFLKDALLERMDDDVPEVVLAALKALEVYVEHLDPADVTSSLLALLHRSDLSVTGGWYVGASLFMTLQSRNLELKNTVCWELLPFLVITSPFRDSPELQLASTVAKMNLLSEFPITQDWSSGEVFWNPEKMDTNTCAYLGLLCRLFELIITGTSQGPLAMSFRALMNPFFQVHLGNPVELFKFLSLLWGYSSNIGDHLDCRVGAVLQTQALYVGRALLAAQPIKNLNMLASAASPVVPTLLLCLSSAVCEVRRAAIATLEIFLGVKSSPFHLLIVALQKATDELISDPTYINQALGKLYEDALVSKGKLSKHQESVEELFKCLQNCPTYTGKTMLRVLQEVNGEVSRLMIQMDMIDECVAGSSVLLIDEALLLQLMLTKYNKHSAPLLAKEPRSLEVLIRAMHIQSQPFSTIPSFQVMALEQITKPFFAALGEKTQQRILEVMFDLLVDNKSPVYVQTVNGVFKAIVVDAELVANELTPADKPKAYLSVQLTRRSKMQIKNTPDAAAPTQEELASAWQRVTLILELLQHKKKLKRPQMLVPALFNLLSRYCFEADAAQLGNMEYTKQLILSCLLNICQKLSPAGKPISKDVLDEDKMNVELVVQCIRVSDKPQTHHHALLLLGTIAGIFPEKVLHNIMPIFTFMGANIMRLDDSYSFQVINKTVQTVIPALIQVGVSETYMECVVTKIMHVFADALPHVPEHRRLPILSQLLGTVGPARFLWVLLLLLFKQTILQAALLTTRPPLSSNMGLTFSVVCNVLLQLSSAATEKRKTHGPKKEETVQDLIFCVERQSGKELRHFKFLTVSFLSQLLASEHFVGKVQPYLTLYPHVRSLLEENLRYIHTVARCVEDTADKPTAKFWRALLNKSYDVLDKVNALLPHDTFIRVVRGLMGNQLPSVRRKAMELLNNRLQQKIKWQEEQVTGLLQLIGDLQSIVGQHRGPEEQAINRQTALYSLKLLCRNFGSTHKEPFVPVLSHVVELVSSPSEEKNVMGSALLCIAEVTITLKALAIPQLHRLMPAVLHTLKKRKDLLSSEVYLLSAVTSLQRVCEALPHFISPYLLDTLLQVNSQIFSQTTTCPQLAVRLASLRNTLATKLPPRVLLPNITKCYNSLVETQQSRLGPLMGILKEHIAHMEKDLLNSHQTELTTFFLCALDFRAQHGQADLHRTKEIEGSVIDCLLVMVIKLSEVTFRPLFFKLFDWCKTDNSAKDRLLTFYRLSDCIAEKLKGLFVLFAGQLVKPFTDMLRQTNIANTDEAFFDSSDSEEKTNLLLGYILQCLHKIFLYDTQKFLSKERSDALMGPLVDQLENMLGGDAVYQERVTQHLVPCIGQFSVALGDDSQWRVLNYQILLKTRHSSPKVRFSALLMVLELASKLRENYIVLLPETIPFLAELMEDECEEVEHQVQKVIQEMEAVLGEPLQSYF